jgi:hypothetical protein
VVARLVAMSEGLVSTANGHVVFGDAVSRVTDSLSPFGAAARIVTQSCALAIELRQLSLESKRIDHGKEVTLRSLEDRRALSTSALEQLRSELSGEKVNAQSLRQMIVFAQLEMTKQGLLHEDRVLWAQIIQTYGPLLVDHTAASGGVLVSAIDAVLNGSGGGRQVPLDVPLRRTTPPRGASPSEGGQQARRTGQSGQSRRPRHR